MPRKPRKRRPIYEVGAKVRIQIGQDCSPFEGRVGKIIAVEIVDPPRYLLTMELNCFAAMELAADSEPFNHPDPANDLWFEEWMLAADFGRPAWDQTGNPTD